MCVISLKTLKNFSWRAGGQSGIKVVSEACKLDLLACGVFTRFLVNRLKNCWARDKKTQKLKIKIVELPQSGNDFLNFAFWYLIFDIIFGRYPVKPPEQGTSEFRVLHFNKQFGPGLWKEVDKAKSWLNFLRQAQGLVKVFVACFGTLFSDRQNQWRRLRSCF